jgi:putative spermidine/putrescine transport system substrate-binding protein
LFEVLMSRKRTGHFARFWDSTEDSVRLLAGGGCVLGALWSPAFYTMRGLGRDLVYAAPVEGYRGWHSGLCLSARMDDRTRDHAYAYLNWWLDGTPGAIMARQGYYISVIEPLRETMSPAEWGYWYGGEPSTDDLQGTLGTIVVRRGERREGGSHLQRVANVSVWSTIMSEQNYLARRWREFLDD